MPSADIYLRVSQDRTGEELGVARHLKDCRTLARLRGYAVDVIHVDNDLSASTGKHRPDFEALMGRVESGACQTVIVWNTDRLTRNRWEGARIVESGLKTGLRILACKSSDMDLSTPGGRLAADIYLSVARHEVELKSERQKAAVLQAAQSGRWYGGRRAFGYEADGRTIVQAEADQLRKAYDAVLAGTPGGAVARAMNQAGFHTPQATQVWEHGCADADRCPADWEPRRCPRRARAYDHGCDTEPCPDGREAKRCPNRRRAGNPSPWTWQTLRLTLTNPRYAGLRAHMPTLPAGQRRRGSKVTARMQAVLGPAEWDGIVDEETWRTACDIIANPARSSPPRGGKALLTGVARCGVGGCNATVHAGGAAAKTTYRTYRCSASTGHVARNAEPVDDYVRKVVARRLRRADAGNLLAPRSVDVAALVRAANTQRVKLETLAVQWAEDKITEAQLHAGTAAARRRLAEVEAQMPSTRGRETLVSMLDAPDPGAAFLAADVDRQRTVIDMLATVTLLPPGRGVRTFRPETVLIDWRQPASTS